MIVHKGPHYKLELELLIQEIRELAFDQPLQSSTIHFLNSRIEREFIIPFNRSLYPYLGKDAITRCEYKVINQWVSHEVKLSVDVHNMFMDRLNQEDVSKSWPFCYN